VTETDSIVSIRGVTKRFGSVAAVDAVDLDIRRGEFFALLGPSGCGKTTLLRMLAGLELPSEGEIRIDGQDMSLVQANKRPVNMVFQSYAVFPHMSVVDNVMYGLKVAGVARAEARERAEEALSLVKLGDYGTRMPDQLSGGQRQRVALARALVKRPKVLLLDEPLSALDAKLREQMRLELVNLQENVGITFVVVTHDQDEALSMADRIAVMRAGVMEQVGTPAEIYHRPNSMYVAGFVGSPAMNFLAARGPLAPGAQSAAVDGAQVPIPPPAEGLDHDDARLGARPEHVYLDDAGPLRGSVFGVEYMGTRQILTVDTTAGRLRVRAPNNARAAVGETVGLTFRRDALILFDGRSGRAIPTAGAREDARV